MNKSPKKLQAEYDTDNDKLEKFGVARDENGKIFVCVLHENNGAMTYFFDERLCKRRINTSTFNRWLTENKAVRVVPDAFKK